MLTDLPPTRRSFGCAPASWSNESGSESSYWPVREGVSVDYLPFTLSSEPWLVIYRHQGDPKNGKKLLLKSGTADSTKKGVRGCKNKATKAGERLRSAAVRTSPVPCKRKAVQTNRIQPEKLTCEWRDGREKGPEAQRRCMPLTLGHSG